MIKFRNKGNGLKLVFQRGLSTLAAVLLAVTFSLIGPAAVQAHEVRPAIADVTVTADTVQMEIRLTAEAFVAGIDLQGLDDTNAAPESDRYDDLRALEPADMAAAWREAWPGIVQGVRVSVDDTRLEVRLVGISVPEVGDLELARDSIVTVTADLPPGNAPVVIGWAPEYGPLVLRQQGDDEDGYSAYLADGQDSEPLPREGVARDSMLSAFATYVVIGFEHIVPKGLDHILFVLGLFFFSMKFRPLLFQVTAFTLAHTVTLALAILGIVSIPASIVEPLIAASIVYVAVENIVVKELRPWRTAVVFGFGLLHGLGFASVLGEIGLDPARFVTGLIGFNIGVELGQLAVILAAFLAVGYWFGAKPWYRARIAMPASVLIALVGAYWFVERTVL